MNYFEHNDSRGRDTREFIASAKRERVQVLRTLNGLNDITLCVSAHNVRERRLEGLRQHKRGMVNEMPYYLYSPRCQRAKVAA